LQLELAARVSIVTLKDGVALEQRSDTALVRAASQGERSAYALLVKRHYKPVFLVCLGVLGDTHDAEDAAQETMIKGFQSIRQLRDAGQFGCWIARIARNLSINSVRKQAAAKKTLNDRMDEPTRGGRHDDDLQDAVTRLPWDLRLPLVMYYYDGRSVKSVAETLDISTSSVYLKLRTAIKELHEVLTAAGDRS